MTITKKIWIIEADDGKNFIDPVIKYSAKEAEEYVSKKYNDIYKNLSNYYGRSNEIKQCVHKEWLIHNGIGTATISTIYGDIYNWYITVHEIKLDVMITFPKEIN